MASNGVGRAAPERTFGTDRAEDCRVLGPGSEGPGAPRRSSRSLVIRTATQPSVTHGEYALRTGPFLPVGNKITPGESPADRRRAARTPRLYPTAGRAR